MTSGGASAPRVSRARFSACNQDARERAFALSAATSKKNAAIEIAAPKYLSRKI